MNESRVPLYMQIVDALSEQIEQGHLGPGQKLPTERSLAESFGVNRRTLRQALDLIERRGLVERIQGSGTFVSQPRLVRGAAEFFHFTEQVRQRGHVAGSKVLSIERVVPSATVATQLEIRAESEIYRVRRLRMVNAVPVVVETFSMPVDLVPGFDAFDVGVRSVYEIMRDEFGIVVASANQSLEAVALSSIEAKWLGAKPGSPAMLERRLAYDVSGRPVDVGTDVYRGDRVRFATDNATVPVSVDATIKP